MACRAETISRLPRQLPKTSALALQRDALNAMRPLPRQIRSTCGRAAKACAPRYFVGQLITTSSRWHRQGIRRMKDEHELKALFSPVADAPHPRRPRLSSQRARVHCWKRRLLPHSERVRVGDSSRRRARCVRAVRRQRTPQPRHPPHHDLH
jgi:hypothetical protein